MQTEKKNSRISTSLKNSISWSVFFHGMVILAILAVFTFKKPMVSPTDVSFSTIEKGVHKTDTETKTAPPKVADVGESASPESRAIPSGGATSISEESQKSGISEPNSYFSDLQKKIQAQERYPLEARKRGIEATIDVAFELNDDGKINEIHAISREKPQILIDAAIEAVRAASPFSPPPAGSSRVFEIPIEFKIK